MDSGEDHHGLFVGAYVCNLLVHVEEVAVALLYNLLAKTLDSVLEVEEYCKTCVVYTEALVATLLCCA